VWAKTANVLCDGDTPVRAIAKERKQRARAR